jgi:hypothetical protein
MKMRDTKTTKSYVVESYQHISNGGISLAVVTEKHDDGFEAHSLEIGLSNFGVRQRCTIPVFSATPNILRIIADELEAKNIVDPRYLDPIIAHVTFQDKEEMFFRVVGDKVAQVKYEDCYGSSEGGQVSHAGSKSED